MIFINFVESDFVLILLSFEIKSYFQTNTCNISIWDRFICSCDLQRYYYVSCIVSVAELGNKLTTDINKR